jgi:hypothetical protein
VGKREDTVRETAILTDLQFDELRKLFQWYVRVTALGAVREISDRQMPRNAWLLDQAGYTQPEIAKISAVSQPTISRILSGKNPAKSKVPEEENK